MNKGSFIQRLADWYRSLPIQPFRGVARSLYQRYRKSMMNRTVTTTVNGVRFELDLREHIDSCLYYGTYENETREALVGLCKPGMTVLDIGSNLGCHTFYMAKAVQPGGCVYAFEPATVAFGKLSKHVSMNPDLPVKANRLALADEAKQNVQTTVYCSWPVDSNFERIPGQPMDRARAMEDSIDMMPLDDFVESNDIKQIDLIKMDVDGHELPVLTGGRKTFQTHRPMVLFEHCQSVQKAYGREIRDVIAFFTDLDYTFRHENTGEALDAEELSSTDNDETTSFNVIAVPPA